MNDDKSNLDSQPSVAEDSSNMAGSSTQHEGVELPPPYSQVPLTSQFPNQPGMHYPAQQQNVWTPQGYPTSYPPGGPQQPQFQLGGCPPQGGAVGPGEIRARQEHAIRQGIAATVITQRYRRRSCTYRLTRLAISFMLVGVIVLIILGVLVIHPALNDISLQTAQCKVFSSTYTKDDTSCDCGRYCTSSYPCLQIQVSYSAEGKRQSAYLYQDVYADKNKCSVQTCFSDSTFNYDDVKDFERSYGTVGQKITCYYNPKTPDEVFKERSSVSSDKMKIMHCILWPMLLVFFTASMLGVLFCRSKGHCCFKNGGSSVPYQDLQAAG